MIETPYLLFLGDAPDPLAAKVAQGIRDWRPDSALGQLRLPGCGADLGLPDMSLAEARAAGARTLVIGVANRGGVISTAWKDVLIAALEMGYDLASGLHNLLRDEGDLVAAAQTHGGTLHDVRVPTVGYPIANGRKRSGKRVLAVGTDCSVGKMYTALALDAAMRERGMKSTFRATGQTGILITGHGVPLDAVIADFMAGSVEYLTPDNDPDHWDIIEGQGSLFHVSYSGVTLALIHGGQPDALILSPDLRDHLAGEGVQLIVRELRGEELLDHRELGLLLRGEVGAAGLLVLGDGVAALLRLLLEHLDGLVVGEGVTGVDLGVLEGGQEQPERVTALRVAALPGGRHLLANGFLDRGHAGSLNCARSSFPARCHRARADLGGRARSVDERGPRSGYARSRVFARAIAFRSLRRRAASFFLRRSDGFS